MALLSRRAIAIVIALCAPAAVRAQGWPESGLQLGVGISAIDGKGVLGGMVAFSRAWGPIVGSLGGEVRVVPPPKRSPMARFDPLTGKTYCGARVIDPHAENCVAGYGSEGVIAGELGVLFSPTLPVILSAGVRSGFVSEPFVAGSVFGSTSYEGINWVARVAAGRKVTMITMGVSLEIGAPRP